MFAVRQKQMTETQDYIGIEGRILDAVAEGFNLPIMVAFKLNIQPYQAIAVMGRLVAKGLLRKVECEDFFGKWYEYEERLP